MQQLRNEKETILLVNSKGYPLAINSRRGSGC